MKLTIKPLISLFCIFTLLTFLLPYHKVTNSATSVVSPKSTIINTKSVGSSFDNVIASSDLIAFVQIKDKANDIKTKDNSLVFSADIIRSYKSNQSLPDNSINIIQHKGNNYSSNNYPIFKKGDQLIVFLKKAPDNKNTYSIIGDETNTYIVTDTYLGSLIIKLQGKYPELSKAEFPNEIYEANKDEIQTVLNNNKIPNDSSHQIQIMQLDAFLDLLVKKTMGISSKFISINPPIEVDNTLINASDKFGMDIFKIEASKNKDKNIIVSPLSLFTAFNIVLNGADGDTKSQMKSVMSLKNYSDDKINSEMNKLINDIDYTGEQSTTKIFNSLWINKNYNLKNSFINTTESYYGSDTFKRDFGNENTIKDMNKWIDQKSSGLIKDPINRIDEKTVVNVFNVLYFSGKWTIPFDKQGTHPGSFTATSGTSINTDMMRDQRSLKYYEDNEARVGCFDYYNGHMLVILPKGDINSYTSSLTAIKITKYNQALAPCLADIEIPKLNLYYGNDDMISTLKKIGMLLPFDERKANFSKIEANGLPLYINKVIHACALKLDEEGTQAAGFTSISVDTTAAMIRPKPIEFLVNKPFIFVIQSKDNTTLFIGKIEHPGQTNP